MELSSILSRKIAQHLAQRLLTKPCSASETATLGPWRALTLQLVLEQAWYQVRLQQACQPQSQLRVVQLLASDAHRILYGPTCTKQSASW